MPSPEVALAWGSQSASRILRPLRARHAAKLMAVVVLPTPPFWFTIPRILPMVIQSIWKAGFGGRRPGLWRIEKYVEIFCDSHVGTVPSALDRAVCGKSCRRQKRRQLWNGG